MLLSSGMAIMPAKNLINNLGLSDESTHFSGSMKTTPKAYRRIFMMKRHELEFPLKHPRYILEDELRNNCARPMFVPYRHWWNYAAEAILLLLFAGGIWAGRKHRFLWLALSYFALDLFLHIGLGFGLNEVYIMTAHWIYVLPIAMAYLCKSAQGRFRKGIITTIGILTVYLILYNGSLIFRYFCL